MQPNTALIRQFLEESLRGAGAIEQFTNDPDKHGHQREVMRWVHTIKASAGIIGFDALSEYAHRLEEKILKGINSQTGFTPESLAEVLKGLRALESVLQKTAERNGVQKRKSFIEMTLQMDSNGLKRTIPCDQVVHILRKPEWVEIPGGGIGVFYRHELVPIEGQAAFIDRARPWVIIVQNPEVSAFKQAIPVYDIIGFSK